MLASGSTLGALPPSFQAHEGEIERNKSNSISLLNPRQDPGLSHNNRTMSSKGALPSFFHVISLLTLVFSVVLLPLTHIWRIL
jgi:hypothetical protein